MKIEKSMLWDNTTPFTDSERSWLTAQLKKETRTPREWDDIMQLLAEKTVFSFVAQGGTRFEKYSREGILYDPRSSALFIGSTQKELEMLYADVFGKRGRPDRIAVTVMSFQAAVEVATRENLMLMLDVHTSGSIRFVSFSGQTGQVNATMVFDPNNKDMEALLKAALKNGGRFA